MSLAHFLPEATCSGCPHPVGGEWQRLGHGSPDLYPPCLTPQPPSPSSFSFSTCHVDGPPTHLMVLRPWEGLSFSTPIFKKPELKRA